MASGVGVPCCPRARKTYERPLCGPNPTGLWPGPAAAGDGLALRPSPAGRPDLTRGRGHPPPQAAGEQRTHTCTGPGIGLPSALPGSLAGGTAFSGAQVEPLPCLCPRSAPVPLASCHCLSQSGRTAQGDSAVLFSFVTASPHSILPLTGHPVWWAQLGGSWRPLCGRPSPTPDLKASWRSR